MRVLELEIHNIRGIPNLHLKPNGRNFVIWGPNGSGKSAVVDAIDFLLTGRITRLRGRGTGDISLQRHGPHVDHAPEDATVRALLLLPGMTSPLGVKRSMARPGVLECEESVRPRLQPILTLAQSGQHVLTRREILKYITAEPRTRAEEIQELLNISEIEEIRRAFVSVENDFKAELQAKYEAIETAKASVNATVQKTIYDQSAVLEVVNQNRAVLGGQPISSLRSAELRKDLRLPTAISAEQPVNVTILEKDIRNLLSIASDPKQTEIAPIDEELRARIAQIRSDPEFQRAVRRHHLTELGISLIDESGQCPLCDTPWPPGKLQEYLQRRLNSEQIATQSHRRISELSQTMFGLLKTTSACLSKVMAAAKIVELKDSVSMLQTWMSEIEELNIALTDPLSKYPDPRFSASSVILQLAPANSESELSKILATVRATFPETTPEQDAWETLIRLEENIKSIEVAENDRREAELNYQRAHALHHEFVNARDLVLGNLYKDVQGQFVDLYKQLHGSDEGSFTATIEPEEAGIKIEVDFYGRRGKHPPHALHSEGHQDSMGICLYLALAERLTKGVIDLLILDDVVMSVDTDHRRPICQLLTTSFNHRQFLITTHDKTWARQLKTEGVVDPQGMAEFYAWNIDTGPRVNYEVDIWERIRGALLKEDVPGAAHTLRRGSEQFFEIVCDALQARVTYKLHGNWDLGDFLPAAMGQYKELVKKAKNAANSWDDQQSLEMLKEVDNISAAIFRRTQAEQWAVDSNVHFNSWANFTKNDFQPVVEAFLDLHSLFVCSKCGSILRLVTRDTQPISVRCNCGNVDWNLMEK